MSTHRLVTAVAAALIASAAQVVTAAELELPYKAAHISGWTGCYGGIHVGVGAMKDTWTDETQSLWGFGLIGGGQLGCNYQLGRFVIGLESEAWGSSLKVQRNFADPGFASKTTTANPWDFATSARAGLAFDDSLVYLKGGIVWGGFSYEYTSIYSAQRGSAVNNGVLFGVGFEHAFAPQWTAKVEANVLMFSGLDVNIADFSDGDRFTISATQFLFKIGVNRRFTSDFSLALD